MPSAPFPVPDPERPLPSVTRQAFSAMYRKSRLSASGGRARNTMARLEDLIVGTEADTRFEFEGTVSGGDEQLTCSRWGWEAVIDGASRRVRACFLVPHTKVHEVAHG